MFNMYLLINDDNEYLTEPNLTGGMYCRFTNYTLQNSDLLKSKLQLPKFIKMQGVNPSYFFIKLKITL